MMIDTKFDSNIFVSPKGRKQIGTNLFKEQERLCRTCGNYNKDELSCPHLGKIKNPNCISCSWWKEKFEKVIKTKRCSKCGELKPIDKFYKDKSSNDGHQYKCSRCAIEYGKEWQKNNKEIIREYGGLNED